jgi:hypothetical protein
MRTKQQKLKCKRVQRVKTTDSMPPIGAPSWCLSTEALEKLGRDTNNIPSYECDSDEEDGDIQNRNTDSNNNSEDENGSSSHKRKKKNKSNKKGKKGEKKHKSKKRRK